MSNHQQLFAPPAEDVDGRKNLVGLSRDDLRREILELGEPAFRAKQLWHWIYARGATDFAEMTSLSKGFRTRLAERYRVARPAQSLALDSRDGTRKWLLRLDGGHEVECVHIPETERGTLCVSSQVGCTLTCRFCHTGTQRLVRNLSAGEIVGQIMLARDHFGQWASAKEAATEERHLTNIVMMGMGEPLYNYDNIAAALKIAMDNEGLAISKRRITLSTAGVVPMMQRCGEELGVNLAVSLHAVTDEIRDEIVPLNKKYPLKDLLDACRAYPGVHNARRITFEYVMLKGVNDSAADARALVRLLKDIPAKVNLIPFNPWPGAPYECSSPETVEAFAQILLAGKLAAPIRRPRGQDIMAACGQLKSASERLKKSLREATAAETVAAGS